MEGLFFRLVPSAGPAAAWAAGFSAVVIVVFVVYIGIAMVVVLRTEDVRKAEIRYRVFRDLVALFRWAAVSAPVLAVSRRGRPPRCLPEVLAGR